LEINVPTIAKFLNNQTFNSEYEEKSCFMGELYETPNLAYEYAIDRKNNVVIYLLFLPICKTLEKINKI